MVIKSVLAIIFLEESVLLIKRRDVPVWVLPGGGIEEGESGEDAIIRECKEEIGVQVEVVRLVATYTGGFFIKPVYLFECKVVTGLIFPGIEAKEASYFPLTNLPKQIPPPFEEFIQDARKHLPPFERRITSITIPKIFLTLIQHPLLFARFILSRLGLHLNS